MPVYKYTAITDQGIETSDEIEAPDVGAVATKLERLNYLPVDIREKRKGLEMKLFSKSKKVKSEEIIVFTKQLVTLLKAGVPLLSCLEALMDQAENPAMKKIIQNIYFDIEGGLSFSGSLRKYPSAFSELYVNSIMAGEAGGALDDILQRLSDLMEHDNATQAKIKAAMRYPMIVVISLVVAFVALMMLVVPNFIDLFRQLKVDLPAPTRILIGLHGIIANYWYWLLAAIALTYFGFKKYISLEKGAMVWDKFKISMPMFGDLNMKTAMSRFTRMFETLNSSGLPILQALEITAKTVGNRIIQREIELLAVGVLQGQGLGQTLGDGKVFPPMVIRMISIGEKSGSLDSMLLNVSRHYDTEVEYAVQRLTSMIEPVLTVAMGVIVLFLAMAIFLPMWDLTKIAG